MKAVERVKKIVSRKFVSCYSLSNYILLRSSKLTRKYKKYEALAERKKVFQEFYVFNFSLCIV